MRLICLFCEPPLKTKRTKNDPLPRRAVCGAGAAVLDGVGLFHALHGNDYAADARMGPDSALRAVFNHRVGLAYKQQTGLDNPGNSVAGGAGRVGRLLCYRRPAGQLEWR